jgi:hypothetical protein
MHRVQYIFIAERDMRVRPQAAKETQACRAARRTRKIDP